MRENLFNVYIYKSPNKSVEVENTLHLLFYIWKRRSKGGCPEGEWKDFLFMIVSILPVSLIRRNNIIHKVAQIFLSQNGRLILV